MMDPLKAFLQANSLEAPAFPPTSRYYGLVLGEWTRPDGRPVAFSRRRFVPPPETFSTLEEHVVGEGDRLDNIASQYLGDPEQYWKICDANRAMRPDELIEEPGARLRITLPHGIPGAPDV